MNWKIFLPLFFAALLFVGSSTAALADNYRGHSRSLYSHKVSPRHKHFGYKHDYRWNTHGGHKYDNKWKYQGKHYHHGPSFRHHYYPNQWHGGPFFGGTLFLPGWGVVFGHHGRW